MKKINLSIITIVGLVFLLSASVSDAAILQRGTATTYNSTSNTTTVALTKPTGVVEGDMLVLFTCDDDGGTTVSTATGWTAAGTLLSDGTMDCYVYYKTATSSEGASYNIVWSSANTTKIGILSAFYSDDSLKRIVYDTISENTFGTSTTHTLNQVTTSVANGLLIGMYGSDDCTAACYSNYTSPLTEITDVGRSSIAVAMASGVQVSAGASGTKAATVTSSNGQGKLLALKEAAVPIIVSNSPTNIAGTALTLNGTVNPNGFSTNARFRYGTSNTACSSLGTTTSFQDVGSGTGAIVMNNGGVTGLSGATQYYFCIEATNSQGTSYSEVTTTNTLTGCAPPANGNHSLSSSCAFSGGNYDGVDAGTGTTNTAVLTVSNVTLTINPQQTLSYGSISKPGGTITKFSGGILKKGPLYAPDTDGDGYPDAANTQTVEGGAGYVRRGTLGSNFASTDCNAANANVFINRTVATDADQDGYGTSTAGSVCAGASSTVSGRTYYNNASGTPGYILSGSMLGTSDCLDTGAGAGYVYQTISLATDADQDGRTANNLNSQCVGGYTSVVRQSGADDYWMSVSGNYDRLGYHTFPLDCNDSDEATWVTSNYYVDADGDEYSPNAGTSSVCAGSSAPTGYSGVNVAREVKTYVASVAAHMNTDALLNVGGTNYVYRVSGLVSSRSTVGGTGGLSAFSTVNQTAPGVNISGYVRGVTVGGNSYIYARTSSDCSNGCMIYVAPITGGNIGTFTSTGLRGHTLTSDRTFMHVELNGSQYFYSMRFVSGYYIYRSLISSDGSLGAWTAMSDVINSGGVSKLDNAYTYGVVNGKTYMYLLGGDNGGNTTDINTLWKAEIDVETGEVGTFVMDAKSVPTVNVAERTNGNLLFVSDSGQNYLYYYSGGSCGVDCNHSYKAVLNAVGSVNNAGWIMQANNPTTKGGVFNFTLSGTNHVYNGAGYKSTFGASAATGLDTNDANATIHP